MKIGSKDYSRQIWYVNKSGQYVDTVNDISINVDKNRLTIMKK